MADKAAKARKQEVSERNRDRGDDPRGDNDRGRSRSPKSHKSRSGSRGDGKQARSPSCHDERNGDKPGKGKGEHKCDSTGRHAEPNDRDGQDGRGEGRSAQGPIGTVPSELMDAMKSEMTAFMKNLMASAKRTSSTSSSSSSSSSSSESESDDSDRGHKRHRRRNARKRSRSRSRSESPPRKRRSADVNKHGDSDDDGFAGLANTLRSAASRPTASEAAPSEGFAETIHDLETFFETGDKVGQRVNDSFASIFNASLRRKPNDKALLSTADRYPRPENVPNLTVPKTNDVVWESMRKGPQIVDASLQKVQTCLGKAIVPMITLINDIGEGTAKEKCLADYHQQITDAIRLGSAAFSMLSQARKEVVRNDLSFPFAKLCTWNHAVGVDNLFGEDVMRQLKDLKETSRQFNDLSNKPSTSRQHFANAGQQTFRKRAPFKNKSTRYRPYKGKKENKKNKGEPSEVCVNESPQSIQNEPTHASDPCVLALDLQNTPENFKGGKLADNMNEWQKLTSDQWIIDTIKGYSIEFSDHPHQYQKPHEIKLSASEKAGLDSEIEQFCKLGIVEPCIADEPGSFYGNLFTRVKKDGSLRVIFNLKNLTPFLEKHKFKMETVKDVIHMMRPNCLFSSIDFKHAFFSVPIIPKHRKYLRFVWHGKHFQFTCLPQGLGPASRIFTKILKPVFAHLRGLGLEISGYIDDSLNVHDDDDDYSKLVMYAVHLFDKLGFTINVPKSVLPPVKTKIIEHLGFIFNSADMTVTLTPKKQLCIQEMAQNLVNTDKPTIQMLAQFVGKLVATEPGFAHAPVYYKELEIYKNQQITVHKGNYNAVIALPHEIRDRLLWWQTHILNVRRHVQVPSPEHHIESDASNSGWGGIINGVQRTRGQWTSSETDLHINVKELLAAFFMLRSFCDNCYDTHIRLKLDNTTAVACINRMASTKSQLMTVTKQVWDWALSRNITLSAEHLPGSQNIIADEESRVIEKYDAEWMVEPAIFKQICRLFGTPEIDLFATRVNRQLPTYFAWRPDPEAVAIDAFMQPWNRNLMYAFPPFRIIGRVLQKARREAASLILVAPIWPTQPWFPTVLTMLVAQPRVLPRTCLTLPQDPGQRHPLQKLRMGAMLLSGNPSRQQDFLMKLSRSSPTVGEMGLTNNTRAICSDGLNFVVKDRLISFLPL